MSDVGRSITHLCLHSGHFLGLQPLAVPRHAGSSALPLSLPAVYARPAARPAQQSPQLPLTNTWLSKLFPMAKLGYGKNDSSNLKD